MDKAQLESIAERYRQNLLEGVVPFWLEHSVDREHGGYLHHLDRDGSVFDDRKMMWMQGRGVWTFSALYERVPERPERPEWLDAARVGAEFLREKCRDAEQRFYFLVARDGVPLVAPYNWASDAFAVLGWGVYSRASGEEWAAEEASKTLGLFLERRENPKGQWNKAMPGAPSLVASGVPMILLNIAGELRGVLDDSLLDGITAECIETIRLITGADGTMYEFTSADGSRPAGPDGRHVNPGHAIEMSWFLLEEVRRRATSGKSDAADDELVALALKVLKRNLEIGWDEEHGGLYYFIDIEGRPHPALEWNMKLWWPHTEAVYALMLAVEMTGESWCDEWFERVDAYTWLNFPDMEREGAWFGYLDRRGERTHEMKGGRFKGFFHVPRALMLVAESARRRAAFE